MTGNTRAICLSGLATAVLATALEVAPGGDWPMLAHDPARSGATPDEVRPPFARQWYRLFPDEGLMAGVQPVVAGGKVYIGTLAGVLHAIDAATGKDAWTHQAGGPILAAAAVAGARVFFTAGDGNATALDAESGRSLWSASCGPAIWSSPLPHGEAVHVTGRDGNLHAFAAATGELKWRAPLGAPSLSSPALDLKSGRLYAASEDLRVRAFDAATGRELWCSPKLPGVSFRGYHPVVAPDGSVLVTVTPAIPLDAFEPVLLGMVKEVFGDFASWRHQKDENSRLRAANFALLEQPETYPAQMESIRRRLAAEPAYRTFFVLDPATGEERFTAPIVYAESMNGTGAPPLVTPAGKVVVKYQALLRSRYEHYSPFLNAGYLDTASGRITPVMDQTRTYGWHDSLLLVHDEQCQLSAAGRLLLNAHQDNVNAMDLETLRGYEAPFCRNLHEPRPGEAIGIQARLLRGEELPAGKEWLARGTAVYGGGSVIDTAAVVAGDSIYYLPTHELSAGAALIALRMDPAGGAAKESPPPAERFTPEEWRRVQELPWDWDTLATSRLKDTLAALPGPVPGTTAAPLHEEADRAVAAIPDADLDRFVWEVRAVELEDATGAGAARLRGLLAAAVRELLSATWRPLVFPAGKHPIEAYRFFVEPAETLEALARAYPHLDAELQGEVRRQVARLAEPGGPLDGPTGQSTFDPRAGEVRSLYDVPEHLLRVKDDITRTPLARLHPVWLWAHTTGDWGKVEKDWSAIQKLIDAPPNALEEDLRNGHLAGLIAYARIAERLEDPAAVEQAVAAARRTMRERLRYELAHPRGGLITQVPVLRSIFGRWRHLTPEVGRLCAAYAGGIHRRLVDVTIDRHRPTWWLAWNVETLWRNESPFQFPTAALEVFAARALILGEPADRLERFLDLPWCRADLFQIQKLVLALEAHGKVSWRDCR